MTKPHGRHPSQRLTTVRIRNAKRPGRYADGNGLYLIVEPSGAKRWVWRAIFAGKRSDVGLGSVQVVSLAQARDEAMGFRRLVRAGGNPLTERRRGRRPVPTFKQAALQVHAAQSATCRNVKHKAQWLASLERHVFPVFGDRPVNAIESGDVLKALSAIWTTTPETARRVQQRITLVFDWAKASGHRSGDNPTEGVTKVLPKAHGAPRHHAALPYAQVPAFLETLRAAAAGTSTRLAFEFLILTAARTNEVLGARWEEIDREAQTWTIPAARSKAGRAHRIPLARRGLELLDEAAAIADGGPYVFPSHSPAKPLSTMVLLRLRDGLNRSDFSIHGFRSSFRDWAAERTNFPRAVCEAALAHALRDKTEAAYFRSDLFELRRELMDTWAKFATATPADVVSIRA